MKSITEWIEKKLFLKVNTTKSKVVRPTRSKYLGFTFVKNGAKWKVRPTNEKKKALYQMIKGWINYFKIGMMKLFMKDFGKWLRHKIRVIIIKQWKKPRTVYRNLGYINRKLDTLERVQENKH